MYRQPPFAVDGGVRVPPSGASPGVGTGAKPSRRGPRCEGPIPAFGSLRARVSTRLTAWREVLGATAPSGASGAFASPGPTTGSPAETPGSGSSAEHEISRSDLVLHDCRLPRAAPVEGDCFVTSLPGTLPDRGTRGHPVQIHRWRLRNQEVDGAFKASWTPRRREQPDVSCAQLAGGGPSGGVAGRHVAVR